MLILSVFKINSLHKFDLPLFLVLYDFENTKQNTIALPFRLCTLHFGSRIAFYFCIRHRKNRSAARNLALLFIQKLTALHFAIRFLGNSFFRFLFPSLHNSNTVFDFFPLRKNAIARDFLFLRLFDFMPS